MELQCNCKTIDITPTKSLFLAGFANRIGPSTGVHMPLSSRCLIFITECASFCIISNDFMELKKELVNTIKESIASQTSIPLSHIFIHSIHSHSAPIVDNMGMETNEANILYQEQTIDQIISNALATYHDTIRFINCRIKVGGVESFIAANRRYFDEDSGKVIISTQLNYLEDPFVGVIQFVDNKNKVIASMVNYACHPVSLGPQNTLISPDYVGKTRETIEKKWGGICMFLNGASGDINPRGQSSSDLNNPENLGLSLGKSVLESAFSSMTLESVKFANGSVNLPFKIKEISTEFIQNEVKRKKEMQTGFNGWEKKIDQWALAQKRRLGQPATLGRNMEISVLRMGTIIMVFSSGELFNSYHRTLRKQFPEYQLFLFGYINGESGYLPDKKAFGLGGYEVEQAYIFFNEPSALDQTSADLFLKKMLTLIESTIS